MLLVFALLFVLAASQDSGRLILSYVLSNQIRVSGEEALPLVVSYSIPGETVALGTAILSVDRANSFV